MRVLSADGFHVYKVGKVYTFKSTDISEWTYIDSF